MNKISIIIKSLPPSIKIAPPQKPWLGFTPLGPLGFGSQGILKNIHSHWLQPVCSLWFAGQSFHFSAAVFDCRIVPIFDGYQALIMTKHMNNHTMKNAGISIRY